MSKRKLAIPKENKSEAEPSVSKKSKPTIDNSLVLSEINLNTVSNVKASTSKKSNKISSDEVVNDDDEKCDENESENEKYVCRCLYNPRSNDPALNLEKCSINVAFQNHITFPSYKLISIKGKPSALYFNLNKNIPNKHWALLIEIEKFTSTKSSFSLNGKTLFDEEVRVEFNQQKSQSPSTFKWSDIKNGHTLAILYAEKKETNDSIEVTNLNNCYVFNSKIMDLGTYGSKLLEYADLKSQHEDPICFNCDNVISKNNEFMFMNEEKPTCCSKCKMANFCGKSCEARYIESSNHKDLCAQSQTLLNLTSLPRHKFSNTGYLSFVNDEQPKYSFDEKFLQILTFPTPCNQTNRQCGLCWRNYRECWIDKRCSLTKTDCCKKWICDDEDARDMRTFSKKYQGEPSCYKSHWKYSMCHYHFAEGHKGRWNNCAQCRAEQSDYDESLTEWFNFGVNPKPKRQWVLMGV